MRWMVHREGGRVALASYERAAAFLTATNEAVAAEVGRTADAVASLRAAPVDMPAPEASGGLAVVPVRGVLLDEPNAVMDMFGVAYSDYQTIRAQIAVAEADPSVDEIVLDVDSPGGLVAGMFDAARTIASASKPVTAIVSGMSASAAYVLTSQAGRVVAASKAAEFGSVGVAVDLFVTDDVISIASTDAPDKRPDVRTEEGRAKVRAHLDAMHDLLAEAIGEGRGVTRAQIDSDFGRGGLMLADRALAAGMIDEIQQPQEAQAMATTPENQATGVRAALGLSKDTDREELIRACIDIKAKAEAHDEVVAARDQALALVEAGKEQLANAQAQADALKAKDEAREVEAFEARRSKVINAALEENKIVPAQVEKYTAIASNEAGLTSLEELFAVTAPIGLTTASPAITAPTGKTAKMTPKQYAKTYNCSEELAAELLAKREG